MKLFRDEVEHALRNPRYLKHDFMVRKEYLIPTALKVRDAKVVVLDRSTVRTAMVAASASPDEIFQMRERAAFPHDNWWIEIDPKDWDDIEEELVDKANSVIAKVKGIEKKDRHIGELRANLATKMAIHATRKNNETTFTVWFKASDSNKVFNPLLALTVSDEEEDRPFSLYTDSVLYGVWYCVLLAYQEESHPEGKHRDVTIPRVVVSSPMMRPKDAEALMGALKIKYNKELNEEKIQAMIAERGPTFMKTYQFQSKILDHSTAVLASVWRFVTALTFLWSHRRTRRLLTASNALTGAASNLEAHDTHKYVTLDLPRLLRIGQSESTGMGPKKREHEVETHWCHSRKNPGKRWIRQGHKRGDPNLGRVTRTITTRTDLH